MKVDTKYYNLLKSDKKVIELRLFDEKRQNIKIGDEIIFSDANNPNNSFKAIVVNLYQAKNFEELCQSIKPEHAGFSSKTELVSVMERFYPFPLQQKFGVLGIKIKRI